MLHSVFIYLLALHNSPLNSRNKGRGLNKIRILILTQLLKRVIAYVRHMLTTDNIKATSLSNNSYCNYDNTTVQRCFHFRHSSLIITQHCTYEVDSRGFTLYQATVSYNKIALDIKFLFYQLPMQPLTGEIVTLKNVFTRNLERKATSSVNSLLFITTFSQLVCLFKNLVNQVAINLGTWPLTSNSLFKIFG